MFILKVVSIIFETLILFLLVSSGCKSKDASESIGYKVLSLLQMGALAYIIMN